MANKVCPECKKSHGTRKKVCDCGHKFQGHPLSPEPGAWVLDNPKGMPKLQPPPALPEGKITTPDLRDQYVAYHGLGFCLYHYIPANMIEDTTLRALWRKTRRAMQDIVEHMEKI